MKLAINSLSHLTLYTVLSSPVQIQNQVIRLHSLNVTRLNHSFTMIRGGRHKYILVCIDRSRGWLVTDVMNEYHDLVPTLLLISALSTWVIFVVMDADLEIPIQLNLKSRLMKDCLKDKKVKLSLQYCPFVACTYCGITILMFAPFGSRQSFFKSTWLT